MIALKRGIFRFFTFLFFLLFAGSSSAQKMTFCESVSTEGQIISPSDFFTISKKGGFLKIHVQLARALNSDKVLFDLFYIEPETGKEDYENSFRLNAQADWTWFSKEVIFFREGEYIVYAYDESDRLLSVGKVRIEFQ